MYETISPLEAIKKVGSSYGGISDEQAAERLKRYGANKLVSKGKQSIIKRLFNELRNPMTLILIVSAVVSGIVSFIGSEFPSDVIIIMFVVVTNAVLGVVQESKAEKAIESLKEISSPHSKVIRNGVVKIIKSEEVVYGDVVIFEAGYAVPADCRIIESNSLRIEESALTGESVPAEKSTSLVKNAKLGDKTNMAFCGTMVVYGSGKGVVVATGMNTEMGAIAKELDLAKGKQNASSKEIGRTEQNAYFCCFGNLLSNFCRDSDKEQIVFSENDFGYVYDSNLFSRSRYPRRTGFRLYYSAKYRRYQYGEAQRRHKKVDGC